MRTWSKNHWKSAKGQQHWKGQIRPQVATTFSDSSVPDEGLAWQ